MRKKAGPESARQVANRIRKQPASKASVKEGKNHLGNGTAPGRKKSAVFPLSKKEKMKNVLGEIK